MGIYVGTTFNRPLNGLLNGIPNLKKASKTLHMLKQMTWTWNFGEKLLVRQQYLHVPFIQGKQQNQKLQSHRERSSTQPTTVKAS